MDSSVVIQVFVLFLLLACSAFFSSAETALTTVKKIRIKTLAEEGNKRAQAVLKVTADSCKMLSAILIGNNIVNISASSLATTLAIDLWGSVGAGIATGFLTILILVFGEITPKTLATIHAEQISMNYAGLILFIMKILTPIIFIINKLAMAFLVLLRINPNANPEEYTETELRTIVDESHEQGVIEKEEREMIRNVFDFGDADARSVMVPRIDMTFANIDDSYATLIEIFREDKFTRLPVYEGSTDNVIGTINMKDLLLCDDMEHFSIRSILREPYYTYEHKNTSELLIEMRESSINIAIVLDEYGATAGLITLEDLLEEIVGEIRDEYDMDEEDDIQEVGSGEYSVGGSTNLADLNNILNLSLISEDYDSIGGYMIGLLDHLPSVGESIVTEDGILLRVEAMDKNRIDKIYLSIPQLDKDSIENL